MVSRRADAVRPRLLHLVAHLCLLLVNLLREVQVQVSAHLHFHPVHLQWEIMLVLVQVSRLPLR